ncbi:MAG TPA: DUF4199 domain-containing protein [Flavobacterium sp.]|jgi:hypothetical protein
MGKFSIEIKWGILFAIAILAWAILERTLGFYSTSIGNYALYTNLFALVAIALYVLALREKSIKYYKGIMSWRQGFVSGVYLTVVITVLSPLCQIIIHKLIAPEFLPNMVEYKVQSGYLSRSAAVMYFNLESYIYQSSQFALSMGIVTAAAVAYFAKTKNNQQ